MARSAAAESVVKNGFPVPPAKMTTRPFSRWRIARRRMNGSATARISIAVCTRVGTSALLERVLQRQGVDHRGEHPHVVAGHPVDALVAGRDAADDVAAADHDRQLDAEPVDLGDLVGDPARPPRLDAEALRAHQGLAGELEQHPSCTPDVIPERRP